MTSRLKNNITELYETFEKYHANSNMSGSPNYSDLDEWNRSLFSKYLSQLHEDDLARFVGSAHLTWGEKDDFKHFLPRIFELTAELRVTHEIWIVFEKLSLSDWTNWPANEQHVIHEYIIALWENILNDDSEKAAQEFQDYFSAISNTYPNFTDLLEVWSKSESK